jgi:ParB family chromosome partitioning protein
MIAISSIDVGKRRRALDDAFVAEIAESMSVLGQIEPIVVKASPQRRWSSGEGVEVDWRLVAGRHRLEAAKLLGWPEISADECELGPLLLDLAEIDENLVRHPLSALEEAEHLAARKLIYEQLHPETRHGGDRKSERIKKRDPSLDPASFADDTGAKTGMSPTVIRDAIRVINGIDPAVRDEIRGMPEIAGVKVALEALARLPPDEQAVVVAAHKRGESAGVPRKPAKPGGKRARSLTTMVSIIVHSVTDPDDIWCFIAAAEDVSPALANALRARVEPKPPPEPVFLSPRVGSLAYWPNGNLRRLPNGEPWRYPGPSGDDQSGRDEADGTPAPNGHARGPDKEDLAEREDAAGADGHPFGDRTDGRAPF